MRKFVILEEQPDYYKKVQGLTPKGHMNIEVRDGRGKLTLNVDNLKINQDEEKLYKACLVGIDNKNYVDVDLGVIILNDKGKGSLEWRFDPVSVGGTSLSIEKFNNVIVKEVDIANENNDMVIPLSGYIYKKDGSLVKIMKKQSEKEPHRKQEIKKQNIEAIHLKEPAAHNKEILEEVESEETLKQSEVEEDNIEEDTYIALEKASIEDEVGKTEKIEETEETEEMGKIEELKIEEVNVKEIEPREFKPEELGVENLSLEDIIPLDIELYRLENQDIDVEEQEEQEEEEEQEKQEEQEEHEQEEQVDSTETIRLGLETGEEIRYGDDFIQNHQVTYSYGDYIDNTYGYKINKMDAYMEIVKNYSMQVANYTMDILKFFERVEPFRENLRDCTWWKIEHSNEDFQRGFLPFYNYLVNVYYPYPLTSRTTTCQSMIEKYGHYIFGTVTKQEEIQYYVYGVPGKFAITEHPYNGSTGFNTWLRDKNSSEDLGYWLVYVDALSGKIINPANPTIPTR